MRSWSLGRRQNKPEIIRIIHIHQNLMPLAVLLLQTANNYNGSHTTNYQWRKLPGNSGECGAQVYNGGLGLYPQHGTRGEPLVRGKAS